jgi:drug/metabolite transporter (DMT)-like permease
VAASRLTLGTVSTAQAVRTGPTTHRLAGGLMIVLSATGYGFLALFATQAWNTGLSEVAVMAFRFAIAAAVLWLIVAARRPVVPSRRTLAATLLLGGLCWSIQSVAYLTAVTRVGASLASLLLYMYPLIVAAVAVLTGRQRWDARLSTTLGLVLVGLALVFGVGLVVTGLDPLGVGAGLVAAVSYTSFILAGEPLSDRIDPFLFTALAITGAACATGALTAAQGGVDLSPVIRAAVPLLGLALLSTVAPGLAFLFGLRRVGASTAAFCPARKSW